MPGRSRKVAIGGLLTALSLICIYLAVYLPTSRLFFYGVSSVFSSIMLIESGRKYAWVFYCATSLLALVLIPNKLGVLPYVAFFGIYGILKYYIESLKNIVMEIIIKGMVFVIMLALAAFTVRELFMYEISSKLPLLAIGIVALIVFYIYDYAYSKFISFYMKRLKR